MVDFRPGLVPNDPTRPRLHLADFMLPGATAPESVDFDDVPVISMFANNRYGDCVFAGNGHTVQQQTFFGQGREVTVTDKEILDSYSRTTGFDPRKPSTDTGARLQDGLDDFRKNGLAGHKIAAFAELDLNDFNQVKLAIAEFGSVAIALYISQSAVDQFNNGEPWDAVPNDGGLQGGHRITAFAYDAQYIYVATWGAIHKLTYAFWKEYVIEAWAQISPDWISQSTGKTPTGIDTVALGKRFSELTGQPDPFNAAPSRSGHGSLVDIIAAVIAAIAAFFGRGAIAEIGSALTGVWRNYPAVSAWLTNIAAMVLGKFGLDLSIDTVIILGAVIGSVLTVVVHRSTTHVAEARALAQMNPDDPAALQVKAAPLLPKLRRGK